MTAAEVSGGGGSVLVWRRAPRRGWTAVPNVTVYAALSYRALGLLVRLLAQPDRARIDGRTLADQPGREGRDAVYAALRELADAGYLHRRRRTAPDGRWVTECVVVDRPSSAADAWAELDGDTTTHDSEPDPADPAEQGTNQDISESWKPGFGTTRQNAVKPQVAPNPGFQDPVNQDPVDQDVYLLRSSYELALGVTDETVTQPPPPSGGPGGDGAPRPRGRADPADTPDEHPYASPAARHPSAQTPCTMCRHVHHPADPHVRRQPPAVAKAGAAKARAALQAARDANTGTATR